MQMKPDVFFVTVLIEMIDTVGIEKRGPTLDAVNRVAFFQQQLGKIGAVLAGDTGDKGDFVF